ncbi:MAG: molybdopterin-dependent oxidoreductase [Actinomycetota bacterium]|nr:molybdopterin-dependent oxidoreductase [Actinomycetota bacterium]
MAATPMKTPAALLRARDRLPDQDSFTSPLHSERSAAILGLALGVCFTITFLTGLISHFQQHPPGWLTLPSRPAGFYRITQGLHVITGVASIPLLFGKLWVVNPYFWGRPAVRDATHAVERISLLPLVGGSVFMVFTGTINVARWYGPMPFFFTTAHYWVAYILIGSLIIHVGAKIATTRLALSSRSPDLAVARNPDRLGRRGFLGALAATSLALVVTTAGETFRPLRRLGILAPRDPDTGSQGIPVNRPAIEAAVVDLARDPGFRLKVDGKVGRPLSLSLDDLRAMAQNEATLPISCVEGWSASATWRGVRVRDLLEAAGASGDANVVVESLEPRGVYRTSNLNHIQAGDADTLLALELDGQVLNLDHGYPVRLIAPNRPGVLQTKWVSRLAVT